MLRTRRLSSVVGLAALLVPLVSVLSYVPRGGVPEAEGCGGNGLAAGWGTLHLLRAGFDDDQVEDVATDGFFVFGGRARGLSGDAAIASVDVKVTDEAGELVPGRVAVLREGPEGSDNLLLGWSADRALEVGDQLHGVIVEQAPRSGVEPLRAELDLKVAAVPSPLEAGELEIARWVDFRHGVGERVQCASASTGCSSLSVPSAEEQRHAFVAQWRAPQHVGYVAWRLELVEEGESGAVLPAARDFFVGDDPFLGVTSFALSRPEYCVSIKIRDLHTGQEAQSEPLCAEPEPPARGEVETDTSVGQCPEPPNAALVETWCRLNPDSTRAECAPSTETGAGGESEANATTSALRGSGGCQAAAGAAGGGSAALSLLALALLRRRRGPAPQR